MERLFCFVMTLVCALAYSACVYGLGRAVLGHNPADAVAAGITGAFFLFGVWVYSGRDRALRDQSAD